MAPQLAESRNTGEKKGLPFKLSHSPQWRMPAMIEILTFSNSPNHLYKAESFYIEKLTSHLYLERPAEIKRYREAINPLRDSALSVNDSMNRRS